MGLHSEQQGKGRKGSEETKVRRERQAIQGGRRSGERLLYITIEAFTSLLAGIAERELNGRLLCSLSSKASTVFLRKDGEPNLYYPEYSEERRKETEETEVWMERQAIQGGLTGGAGPKVDDEDVY